ncbi:ParA family protein [Weissella viridescens]|uniref:ParA family protein n=1 Tax=Weissella viridescens TaxID=1629 RepID=UPI003AF260F4
MKTIAFLTEKGGAGKTTQSYNFAEYLAFNKFNVLLIDMDQQKSLTSDLYGIETTDGTSVNFFRNTPVITHKINEYLDFIPSSLAMDLVETELMPRELRAMTLGFWFQDHANELKDYDYIIFDCHPDFKTVNQNVAAFCDIIISPLEPSQFGIAAKHKIEARFSWLQEQIVNPATRKTLITSKLLFINNLVDIRNLDSKMLMENSKNDPSIIASLPKKQLFAQSIRQAYPVIKMSENTSLANTHDKFFKQFFEAYEHIKNAIDN